MAYDGDLRQKVLHAVDTKQASQARLAEIFGVSLSWLKGVVRRRRETGNTHAFAHRSGKRPKLTAEQREQLRSYVTAHDDLLLRQVQAWLETSSRIRLSVATLSRVLRRLNLPRKKDTSRHGARHSNQSTEARTNSITRSDALGLCR
jgi:transposase